MITSYNGWDSIVRVSNPYKSDRCPCLPDVSLGRLSVSHETVDPVGGLVPDLADVGHTAGDAEALKRRGQYNFYK